MKNRNHRLFILCILCTSLLVAQTVVDLTKGITNTPFTIAPANEWTRTLPADEPFGAPPAWIAMRFDGPVEIFAPVSALSIKHPVYGYAARPGNWHWRRIDDETRALLLGMNATAIEPDQSAEIADLKARISNAVAVLTYPTPRTTPANPATAKE